mmetsp:Transcript_21491/g.31197  ORF Transcript_21491/g.31197 Transcript_21491/m.31197 type:complete len:1077 (-) Transcript_21491:74-3304(-)|eukprot:CAMPEP_0185037396 /NCGR_PEP_ID=MMETSP1103-20130426/31732_1 /TAXON_ID=36769 /ORGANISM="Paraphysomonas bandaiensis, Strain Caron Lab Isolate" /LENGTH=1076 /DNA_ID=CAMNT_0027575349 /DNA_START=35 /DNA_END=3265 /DNA_ORIENTATION=+
MPWFGDVHRVDTRRSSCSAASSRGSGNSVSLPQSQTDELFHWIRTQVSISGRESRPDDYYYNPDNHEGWVQKYLDYTIQARDLVENDNFNYFIIIVIIIAGINIGIQSYDRMSNVFALDMLDNVILIVFSFEVVVKILAEGLAPMMYFIGPEWKWNNFDFAIVFMSLPFWDGLFGGGSLALLRLVRLMRLAKLIKKVPQLQMIVQGLTGGLSSIGYILLLLLLVFYLFAVVGFYMFGKNDPFHFGSLPLAMMTLFRCSTLDAWSDVMYLNIFGCDGYAYLYVSEEDQDETNELFWCENPKGQFVLSTVYFVVFVVVSALVMLSLFIGAVTLSMADSLNELKAMAEEKKKADRFRRGVTKMFLASARIELRSKGKLAKSNGTLAGRMINRAGMKRVKSPEGVAASHKTSIASVDHPEVTALVKRRSNLTLGPVRETVPSVKNDKDEEEQTNAQMNAFENFESRQKKAIAVLASSSLPDPTSMMHRKFSMFMPAVLKEHLDHSEHDKVVGESIEVSRKLRIALGELPIGIEDEPKTFKLLFYRLNVATTWKEKFLVIAEHLKFLTEHPKFVGFVTFVIVLAGVNVGAQTDPRIYGIPIINDILNVLDILILAVFTMECVFKILSEGLHPFVYFHDNWNKFDFIIVVGSYIPGAGSMLTILRLLRLLRVLKLVKSLPQLAVIVNALMMGLGSIGYIGLILFLCFYVFAILGMILFRKNDPFHFGNLHISMFTLFRMSTLDDWTEIMYVNVYGCDRYFGVYEDFPEMCDAPAATGLLAAIYFHLFIIIGAQVLLTLFIGVVTTSMEEAQDLKDIELKLERQLKSLKNSMDLSDAQMRHFREVFAMLNLDGGGKIDLEELSLGLQPINDLLPDDKLRQEVKKSDPRGVGIDVITFIIILCNIPACRHKRLLRRTVRRWRANKHKRGAFFSNHAKAALPDTSKIKKKILKNAKEMNDMIFGSAVLFPSSSSTSFKGDGHVISDGGGSNKEAGMTETSIKRRRSGTWVPETDHEISTALSVAKEYSTLSYIYNISGSASPVQTPCVSNRHSNVGGFFVQDIASDSVQPTIEEKSGTYVMPFDS